MWQPFQVILTTDLFVLINLNLSFQKPIINSWGNKTLQPWAKHSMGTVPAIVLYIMSDDAKNKWPVNMTESLFLSSFTTSVKESYAQPFDQVKYEGTCFEPWSANKCTRHRWHTLTNTHALKHLLTVPLSWLRLNAARILSSYWGAEVFGHWRDCLVWQWSLKIALIPIVMLAFTHALFIIILAWKLTLPAGLMAVPKGLFKFNLK